MMTIIEEEKIYKNLKDKLIDTNYFSSSLFEKARNLVIKDQNCISEIKFINNYLLEKIKHGDGISYALIHIVYQKVINRILNEFKAQDFFGFVEENKYNFNDFDLNDNFFDLKVAYLAP